MNMDSLLHMKNIQCLLIPNSVTFFQDKPLLIKDINLFDLNFTNTPPNYQLDD